jgi:hypothetical protein
MSMIQEVRKTQDAQVERLRKLQFEKLIAPAERKEIIQKERRHREGHPEPGYGHPRFDSRHAGKIAHSLGQTIWWFAVFRLKRRRQDQHLRRKKPAFENRFCQERRRSGGISFVGCGFTRLI